MGARRKYTAESYFNFLYSLAFNKIGYEELAHELDSIVYNWRLPMDENRMYDGYDIRKYYLCDELGYLPDGVEIYDGDGKLFSQEPTVLEVMVGFANRIYTDITDDYSVDEWIWLWLRNLDIIDENGRYDIDDVVKCIKKWESGASIFFYGEVERKKHLWDQCIEYLNEK